MSEAKYNPRKFFKQTRKNNSLEASIEKTYTYINDHITTFEKEELFKIYKKSDFSVKYSFAMYCACTIGIGAGVLATVVCETFFMLQRDCLSLQPGAPVNERLSTSLYFGAILLLPVIIYTLSLFLIALDLRRDYYYKDYKLFIVPFKRKKSLEFIETLFKEEYRGLL